MMVTRFRPFFKPADDAAGGELPKPEEKKPEEKKPEEKPASPTADDLEKLTPAELARMLRAEKSMHQHTIQVHGEMKEKYAKREAADAKAKEESLKKQGQFETLYNELSPKVATLESTVKRQEETLTAYLNAELAAVPENLKALIPEGDAASKLSWISKAKAAGAFANAKAPETGKKDQTPPPGQAAGTITEVEFMKMSPKDRAAFMAKGGKIA